MSEYCRDDFGLVEQADDDFKMWQGLIGPHYTPSVSEDGTLSWSNDGQLPNPEDVSIKGSPGEPGPGVPAGGTTSQILAKSSDEDYDTEWIDPPEMDAGQVSYDSTEAYDDGTVGKELGTINSALASLETRLKSGAEEDAELHLGFYLDENGDLCQVEEDENNG